MAGRLDIECFAPRRQLPGAAAHPLFEPPPLPAAAATPTTVPAATAQAAGRRQRGDSALRQRASRQTAELSYHLVAARVGDVLVVDQLAVAERQASPQWLALLGNLLAACGLSTQSPHCQQLRWPPPAGDGGAEAGRGAALGFIAGLADGASWMLLMGADTAQQLPVENEPAMPTQVLRCESLRHCLAQPARKAVLWHQLRELRCATAAPSGAETSGSADRGTG